MLRHPCHREGDIFDLAWYPPTEWISNSTTKDNDTERLPQASQKLEDDPAGDLDQDEQYQRAEINHTHGWQDAPDGSQQRIYNPIDSSSNRMVRIKEIADENMRDEN